MRVAENLEMLDVHTRVMGVPRVFHPTLMWDETNVVLIDTGVPGSLEEIRNQAEAAGAPFARLNHIVFTQQDIDHISGAAELLAGNPGVAVYAHEKDAPHIRGEKKLSRLTDAFMERISDRSEEEQARILGVFDEACLAAGCLRQARPFVRADNKQDHYWPYDPSSERCIPTYPLRSS